MSTINEMLRRLVDKIGAAHTSGRRKIDDPAPYAAPAGARSVIVSRDQSRSIMTWLAEKIVDHPNIWNEISFNWEATTNCTVTVAEQSVSCGVGDSINFVFNNPNSISIVGCVDCAHGYGDGRWYLSTDDQNLRAQFLLRWGDIDLNS